MQTIVQRLTSATIHLVYIFPDQLSLSVDEGTVKKMVEFNVLDVTEFLPDGQFIKYIQRS